MTFAEELMDRGDMQKIFDGAQSRFSQKETVGSQATRVRYVFADGSALIVNYARQTPEISSIRIET